MAIKIFLTIQIKSAAGVDWNLFFVPEVKVRINENRVPPLKLKNPLYSVPGDGKRRQKNFVANHYFQNNFPEYPFQRMSSSQ